MFDWLKKLFHTCKPITRWEEQEVEVFPPGLPSEKRILRVEITECLVCGKPTNLQPRGFVDD